NCSGCRSSTGAPSRPITCTSTSMTSTPARNTGRGAGSWARMAVVDARTATALHTAADTLPRMLTIAALLTVARGFTRSPAHRGPEAGHTAGSGGSPGTVGAESIAAVTLSRGPVPPDNEEVSL